jgi:hypothetical protein
MLFQNKLLALSRLRQFLQVYKLMFRCCYFQITLFPNYFLFEFWFNFLEHLSMKDARNGLKRELLFRSVRVMG